LGLFINDVTQRGKGGVCHGVMLGHRRYGVTLGREGVKNLKNGVT
jgi:hypothetical protein